MTPDVVAQSERITQRNGVLAGIAAFTFWGAFPIYFKVATGVAALEMLSHRIVWSVPFGLLIILLRRQWPQVRRVFATPRTLALLMLSATFISINWLVYIWAVQNEQIFQASLGYYINPLMLMLVGIIFLNDKLRSTQLLAIGLAAAGVAVLTVSGGRFPILSLTLATSFTIYSVVRNRVAVGAMPGLFVETLVLFPLAAVYLLWLVDAGLSPFHSDNPRMVALLLLAGPLTVMPLLFFAVAARRLRLSTIGFLQFIGPSGQFLVGLYYGEPLTWPHMVCFGFIWTAAAVFIFDVWRFGRRGGVGARI